MMLALVMAGALLAGSVIAVWVAGGRCTAPFPRAIGSLPAGLRGEAVAFRGGSGAELQGWFMPGRAGHGAVLLLHGVRGSRLDMLERARFLNADGFAVLLFDACASGESGGDAITFGFREAKDIAPALHALRVLAPGERLGAIGNSMGAASLVLARPCGEVDAMVLEQMYPTLAAAIANRVVERLGRWSRWLSPLLTLQLRPRLGFGAGELRPIDGVAVLPMPKLFIAGGADAKTPLAESEAIHAHAAEPKQLWVVDGAGHEDVHAFATAAYERRVLAFFRRHLMARAAD